MPAPIEQQIRFPVAFYCHGKTEAGTPCRAEIHGKTREDAERKAAKANWTIREIRIVVTERETVPSKGYFCATCSGKPEAQDDAGDD